MILIDEPKGHFELIDFFSLHSTIFQLIYLKIAVMLTKIDSGRSECWLFYLYASFKASRRYKIPHKKKISSRYLENLRE